MKAKLPNGKVIDIVRKHHPRCCDKCGQPYRRRAMIECWVHQNPGHKWGWVKLVVRLGTDCCAGKFFSTALMKMATVQIGWTAPAAMLTPPIDMDKLKVGMKAGIFHVPAQLEPPKKKEKAKGD